MKSEQIDLVAQPVEHIPFKDGVLGSNPSQVTFFFEFTDLVAQPVEHIPFKDGVLGSNPSQVTLSGNSYFRFFFALYYLAMLGI